VTQRAPAATVIAVVEVHHALRREALGVVEGRRIVGVLTLKEAGQLG
jgi:hypothetical protein